MTTYQQTYLQSVPPTFDPAKSWILTSTRPNTKQHSQSKSSTSQQTPAAFNGADEKTKTTDIDLTPRFIAAEPVPRIQQHVLYTTSSAVYGCRPPEPLEVPAAYHPHTAEFTDKLIGTMYRHFGLNCALNKTVVQQVKPIGQ